MSMSRVFTKWHAIRASHLGQDGVLGRRLKCTGDLRMMGYGLGSALGAVRGSRKLSGSVEGSQELSGALGCFCGAFVGFRRLLGLCEVFRGSQLSEAFGARGSFGKISEALRVSVSALGLSRTLFGFVGQLSRLWPFLWV